MSGAGCASDGADPTNSVEAFYAASYPHLVRVLTLAAGSRHEAEEVVQDAFVRLLPRWRDVAHYNDPEAWVRLVAFRLLSNRSRQARNIIRAKLRAERVVPESHDDRLDIETALRQLSLGHRQVVVLRYLVGLSTDEVAEVLRVPAGTVKSRLARALAVLRPYFREESTPDVESP